MSATINSGDADVEQVAAALADAALAGGLSDAYFRKADDALRRLFERLRIEEGALSEATAHAQSCMDDEQLWRERAGLFEARLRELHRRFERAGMVGAADLVTAALTGDLVFGDGEDSP